MLSSMATDSTPAPAAAPSTDPIRRDLLIVVAKMAELIEPFTIDDRRVVLRMVAETATAPQRAALRAYNREAKRQSRAKGRK